MRVVVDLGRCESHGQCMAVAPEVFELDDADVHHVLVDEVPDHLHAKVQQAIANCPKQALSAS